MKFSDFERQQTLAMKKATEIDMECVTCPKCSSQWLEEVTLARFSTNHNLVLGQDVPPRPNSIGYKFLRCAVCANIIEPKVQHFARDLAASDYDYCLDTLEGKHDARTEEEKKKEKESDNAILSEEL